MAERGHEVVVYCRSGHYSKRPPEHLGMQLRYLPSLRQKHLETLSHTALSTLRLPRGTAIVGTAALERFGLNSGGYLLFVGRLVPDNAPDQYLEGSAFPGLTFRPWSSAIRHIRTRTKECCVPRRL
jgi:hypothetical protein